MAIKAAVVLALATLAANFASAQDFNKIPKCAINCIIEKNPLSGCKSQNDFPCLCLTGETYNKEIALCIIGACSSNDV
ncbi:hypothetical protein V8F33_003727 [Rhypophila sp. PSN 637]